MTKKDKIIIIGFGSIGQRHYRNLTKLGYQNIFVFDIDKTKGKNLGNKFIKQLTNVQLKQFKAAFICNPNQAHVKTALACAQAGCHLFIENPLSHSLTGVKELISICRKKKLMAMVASNIRFHPSLQFIKRYLSGKKLGKVYSISHQFGFWLPYWRPSQDYRKNYAARKSTGGGIILDDIHEFDLLFWLNDFSPVKESKFVVGKVSDLKIETEDICLASFRFKNNTLGSVSCDYLRQSYARSCQVIGQRGNLEWDFNQNIVWLKNKSGRKKLFEARNFDFNKVYLDEATYFFGCLKKKQPTFNGLEMARKVLAICLKR